MEISLLELLEKEKKIVIAINGYLKCIKDYREKHKNEIVVHMQKFYKGAIQEYEEELEKERKNLIKIRKQIKEYFINNS